MIEIKTRTRAVQHKSPPPHLACINITPLLFKKKIQLIRKMTLKFEKKLSISL